MGDVLELRSRNLSSEVNAYFAFDPDDNLWVQGEAALHLLIEQTVAEIELLADPRTGPDYWEMIKDKGVSQKTCYDYIVALEKQLVTYLDLLIYCLESPAWLQHIREI